jgi:hypothetical protein
MAEHAPVSDCSDVAAPPRALPLSPADVAGIRVLGERQAAVTRQAAVDYALGSDGNTVVDGHLPLLVVGLSVERQEQIRRVVELFCTLVVQTGRWHDIGTFVSPALYAVTHDGQLINAQQLADRYRTACATPLLACAHNSAIVHVVSRVGPGFLRLFFFDNDEPQPRIGYLEYTRDRRPPLDGALPPTHTRQAALDYVLGRRCTPVPRGDEPLLLTTLSLEQQLRIRLSFYRFYDVAMVRGDYAAAAEAFCAPDMFAATLAGQQCDRAGYVRLRLSSPGGVYWAPHVAFSHNMAMMYVDARFGPYNSGAPSFTLLFFEPHGDAPRITAYMDMMNLARFEAAIGRYLLHHPLEAAGAGPCAAAEQ